MTQARKDLRVAIFDAMLKCSNTSSKVLENITHTRKLMTSLNDFYNSRPCTDDLITFENATDEEKKIASVFLNDFGRFPIEFPPCCTLSDESRRKLAAGFAALRCTFIPEFDATGKFSQLGMQPLIVTKQELTKAVIEAMTKCSETQCAADIHREIVTEIALYSMSCESLREAMNDATQQHRNELRQNVFEAMQQCSRAFSATVEIMKCTWKLMDALYCFYHPYPSEESLITLANSTQEEIHVASIFFNEHSLLPIEFSFASNLYSQCQLNSIKRLREFASGFSALRIELMPQFSTLINNAIIKMVYASRFEETIREGLFIRMHSNQLTQGAVDDEAPSDVCADCSTSTTSVWERGRTGMSACTDCYLAWRLELKSDGRFPLVEMRGGVLKYVKIFDNHRTDLCEQLREEYALTD